MMTKSKSTSKLVFCVVCFLYLLSVTNGVLVDGADAELRQGQRPRPPPGSGSISGCLQDGNRGKGKRFFDVKKRNYDKEGQLQYNIPLVVSYDGQKIKSKENNNNNNNNSSGIYDDVGFLPVRDLVRRSGRYDVKVYNVTTEDSYILQLYRIVDKDTLLPITKAKDSVILQHGMWGTCKDWLMLDKSGSLAFAAADSGYDVWLANSRGTDEARDHEFFLPDESKYWDFSFDEMGRYDLKAVIDKVLKVSRNPSIFFVGHSLGTILFYVFMHYHRNEYEDKIKGMVAMPPSAFLSNTETPLLTLQGIVPILAPFGVPLNSKFPPFQSLAHRILPLFCSIPYRDEKLCTSIFYTIAGVSENDTDTDTIKRIVEHYPNGLSVKTGIHLLQQAMFDGFRMYDYGPTRNFLKYQQTSPPPYNLFSLNVQTFNIYGLQDLIVDRTDAEKTISSQGTDGGKTALLIMEFNHIDLILSKFAAPIVNSRIIKFFTSSNKAEEKLKIPRCACRCGSVKPFCPITTTPMPIPAPNRKAPGFYPDNNYDNTSSSSTTYHFSSYFQQFIK